jgi:hypothetical protein
MSHSSLFVPSIRNGATRSRPRVSFHGWVGIVDYHTDASRSLSLRIRSKFKTIKAKFCLRRAAAPAPAPHQPPVKEHPASLPSGSIPDAPPAGFARIHDVDYNIDRQNEEEFWNYVDEIISWPPRELRDMGVYVFSIYFRLGRASVTISLSG